MMSHLRRFAPLFISIAIYFGLVLVARSWLAPQFEQGTWAEMRNRPEAQRFDKANQRVRTANEALREIVVWDSIKAFVPKGAELSVRINRPDTMYTAQVRRLLTSEIPEPPKAGVLLIGVPDQLGSHPGLNAQHAERFFYAGTTDGITYCAAAVPTHYMAKDVSSFGIDPLSGLGPCRVWAKYGAPGAHIAEWLRRGGYRLAMSVNTDHRRYLYYGEPSFFGRMASRWWWGITGGACLAGKLEQCRRAVLDTVPAAMRAKSAATFAGAPWEWSGEFLPGYTALLAYAEREFGTERFARFWTSPLPVEESFRNAFGVDIGTFVHDWATRDGGRRAAGPGMNASTALLSLILISLLIAFAIARSAARNV